MASAALAIWAMSQGVWIVLAGAVVYLVAVLGVTMVGNVPMNKTLVIFLGTLNKSVELVLTEHDSFQWFDWKPPHQIQTQTIDDLLSEVALHWLSKSN